MRVGNYTVAHKRGATPLFLGVSPYNIDKSVVAATTKVLTLQPFSLDGISNVHSLDIDLYTLSASLRCIVSPDEGATWLYSSGSSWLAAASKDDAFTATDKVITANTPKNAQFAINSNTISGAQSLTFAFKFVASGLTSILDIFRIRVYHTGVSYISEPMVLGGPSSTKADVGLQYASGVVSSVLVKNLTSSSLYLKVKAQS